MKIPQYNRNNIILKIYKGNMRFWVEFFIIPIIPFNKFSYNNFYIVGVINMIRVYVIFAILLCNCKKIGMICYNKSQTSSVNRNPQTPKHIFFSYQNLNFIKNYL